MFSAVNSSAQCKDFQPIVSSTPSTTALVQTVTFSVKNVTMTSTQAGASVSVTTTTVTATLTSVTVSTSVTTLTSTHTNTIVATSNHVVNSTSTTTVVQTLMNTVAGSECLTIKATHSVVTQTTLIPVGSCSPEQSLEGQASDSSFESTALLWMSLFILFLLFTMAALSASIVLACILRKKAKSNSVLRRPEYSLVIQANSRGESTCIFHDTTNVSVHELNPSKYSFHFNKLSLNHCTIMLSHVI